MTAIAYLDNAATTRLAPQVREAMVPWLGEQVGNPSSLHRFGLAAGRAVAAARRTVAATLGCSHDEVVFTSGGTEADALAVLGAARAARRPGHVLVSAVEHPAVLESARLLTSRGWRVDELEVDSAGRVDPDRLLAALRPDTRLVSVMHVNHELGTVQPIAEVARAVHAANPEAVVHCDAVQSFGKLPVDVRSLGVDLLSLSAHKIHGPMGVGALYVRSGVRIVPLLGGGGQERGLRPGTENVPGVVGLAEAAALADEEAMTERRRISSLRDDLWAGLAERVDGIRSNGPTGTDRVCSHLHVSVPGLDSEPLLHALEARGVYASAGSACHARRAATSHVLRAIGRTERGEAHLRLSLSRETTGAEVGVALEAVPDAVASLRR